MGKEEVTEKIEEIFHDATEAHHKEFGDSMDREWPLWYATNVATRLSELLDHDFTMSELVYLMVQANEEQSLRAPGSDFSKYAAMFIARRFT